MWVKQTHSGRQVVRSDCLAKNANASKVMPISLYDLSSKFHSQQHNKLLLITHLVNVSACAAFQFIVAILNSFLRSKINKYL